MANQYKKITDLSSMTSGEITSSIDLLAIVDVSENQTKKVTVDAFITGSALTSGSFTGSFSGSFEGDGSGLTGITAEWDGSHVGDASITGSFTVSGSNTSINFIGAENGVSGSFSGSYSGSFYGDGSGLTGLIADTASYVTSSGVDGPYGMDSILSASYAVSSSQTVSSSYALTSSYIESTGIFKPTGSFYATTNDLQVTGTLDITGNFSTDLNLNSSGNIITTDIDASGIISASSNVLVGGTLTSSGGRVRNITSINFNDTTDYTVLISDDIIYINLTVDGTTKNIITLPGTIGRTNDLLVPSASDYSFFAHCNSGGGAVTLNGTGDISTTPIDLSTYAAATGISSPAYARYRFTYIATDTLLMDISYPGI